MQETLEPIVHLSRDLIQASRLMSRQEIRFLVDSYYTIQEYRKASSNQVRTISQAGEPAEVLSWFQSQVTTLENQIKRALDEWTESDEVSAWAKSITGIGPVLAAGLAAHIDIERAPTVGHIWRFAGLDPTTEWRKGEKRPWNARLRTICWLIGQSFMKFQNHPNDHYGYLYRERKTLESERNERGDYADIAASVLASKRISPDTQAYNYYVDGKLPPAHIDARARRWTVKLFLSHYHEAAYFSHYRQLPPAPYPLAHLGHSHYLPPPNPDRIAGWTQSRLANPSQTREP